MKRKKLTAHGLTDEQKREVDQRTIFNIRTGFYATTKAARQKAIREVKSDKLY